jgi:Flp pilus assembly protein TadD
MPRKRKTSSQPIGAELLQSNFIVNNMTKVFPTPTVEKILDEATPLLRAKKGAQAEILFRKALALEPVQPDLLNNLAQALELQGLADDGLCICETNLILFPDYLLARATLATAAMREGDYEDALALLALVCPARVPHQRI